MCWGGRSSPSRRPKASAVAAAPIIAGWERTIVTPSRSASSKSSNPMRATPSDPASARSAPTVLRLLAVNTRGRPDALLEREQVLDRRLALGRVAVAGPDERRVHRDARRLERVAVAGDALPRRVQLGAVGDAGDARVPVVQQMLDGRPRAAAVVVQHGVGLERAGGPVEEHDGHLAAGTREVAVVVARRDHQQRVDAAAEHRRDDLALAARVLRPDAVSSRYPRSRAAASTAWATAA